MNYYELKQQYDDYSLLLSDNQNIMAFLDIYPWNEKIDLTTYMPFYLKLYPNNNKIKNFKSDIFVWPGQPIIFSEKAVELLDFILNETGQIIPVITKSKRKKFFAFTPNKSLYSKQIINLISSEWNVELCKDYFKTIILNQYAPKDRLLFSFVDNPMIIVNDDFKRIVEQNNLKGFDFSKQILSINEDITQRKIIEQEKRNEHLQYKQKYIVEHGEDTYYMLHTPINLMDDALKQKYLDYQNNKKIEQ